MIWRSLAVRSPPVRNRSAMLVNLLVFTCGYNSCSPGMPCRQQRRPRSEGAASSSTRPSSSSDTTGSLRLSQTQRLLDVNDEMTEDKTKAAVSRPTHLEPAPSRCRSAGAACKPQSASRCLGGHTASGSYRRSTTVRYSVGDWVIMYWLENRSVAQQHWPRFRQEPDFQLWR